jgi:hypothetical protein
VRSALLLALLLTACPHAGAGLAELREAPAPEDSGAADALFLRHLEAIGGEQALRAHHSLRATGRARVEPGGVTAILELRMQAPDSRLSVVRIAGEGMYQTGHDGAEAWQMGPDGTTVALSGVEAGRLRRLSALHAPALFREHYPERRLVGPTEFDGKPALQVWVRTAEGTEEQIYFDPHSGLCMGTERRVAVEQGQSTRITTIQRYERVDDLLFPAVVVDREEESSIEMSFDQLRWDLELEGFSPPTPLTPAQPSGP